MTKTILIEGYDVSKFIKQIPAIDEITPEWGTASDMILNNNITLITKLSLQPFLDTITQTSKKRIQITENAITLFYGFIDKINTKRGEIEIFCKSNTSELFSRVSNTTYIIDNAYPVDIIKDLLELSNLEMDNTSYINALRLQKELDLRFSVTAEKINYAEIIEKVCEVSCGMVYIYDNKFYYKMFSDMTPASIDIPDKDFFDYPIVDNPPIISSSYNGIDVKFGNNALLYGVENPTKIIDMSISSPVYTFNLITAEYISQLYNAIYSKQKKVLQTSLRKQYKSFIKKNDYITYNNDRYRITRIDNQYLVKVSIEGEALI